MLKKGSKAVNDYSKKRERKWVEEKGEKQRIKLKIYQKYEKSQNKEPDGANQQKEEKQIMEWMEELKIYDQIFTK